MTNSPERLFCAQSVAEVGASTDPDKLGHQILASILNGGYEGAVYPVNPKADIILGSQVWSPVSEIEASLDLVVAVAPTRVVPGVLRETASKGDGAGIIISRGSSESGREELERDALKVAELGGIRPIGPNCQGIYYRTNRLCASRSWVAEQGSIAVISRSGTVAATPARVAMGHMAKCGRP